MTSWWRSLSLLCLSALALACGPNSANDGEASSSGDESGTGEDGDPLAAYIQDYCAATLSVSCPWPRYDSVDACVAEQTAALEPWAQLLSLSFDETCAAAKVAVVTGEWDCTAWNCPLFHGGKAVGEDCESLLTSDATECGANMRCTGGSGCQPICAVAQAGESCTDASCDDGLLCVPGADTDQTCMPTPTSGEACLDGTLPCGFELWCDGGVCSDQYAGVGEPCGPDALCDVAQGYCEMGTCAALLADGEACDDWWQCAGGACVLGSCVPLPDTVGAPCHQERRCGGELECDGRIFTCREPWASPVCNYVSWCPPSNQHDGVCDEGEGPSSCPPGADASDCGYCPDGRQGDGQCDEPQFCALGTDPDC